MESNEITKAFEEGIKTLRERQDGIATELKSAMEKYEGQLADNGKASKEQADAVRVLSEDFEKMQAKILEIQQKSVQGHEGSSELRTLGQQFVASDQYKGLAAAGDGARSSMIRVEVKNTVDSDATTVFPFQKPGVISGAFQPLSIRNALRSVPVSSNAVNALREASWTNSAAEVSHGAQKPDSAITFEEYTVNIRTVAHTIKVTNQLLADAPAIAAYIDSRLRDGLAQRVDNQLLNGNGTSPNLSGLTDSGNFTAYTPTSDDTLTDAVNRLKYTMWAAGYAVDFVIVNPADWGAMERTRESAGGGEYLYGVPGMNAGMNPFGVRVVLSKDLAAGKLVAVHSDAAIVYDRQSVVVEMGYENDDFTKNLVTIRAEERLGLGCERPAGIYYGDYTA